MEEEGMEKRGEEQQRTVIIADRVLRRLHGGFAQVPNFILRRRDLSPGAKITYSLLLSYAWQADFCYPAQDRLAEDSARGVRQVQRTLIELRKKNLISWHQRGLNKTNIYTILPILDENINEITDTTDMSRPDTTPMSLQEATPVSHYKDSLEKDSKNHVNVAPNQNGIQKPREALLVDEMVSQLGDKRSQASFTIIARAFDEQVIWSMLGNTKEAHQMDLIKTTKAKYFMGMAKKKAKEHGIDLGFKNGKTEAPPDNGLAQFDALKSQIGKRFRKAVRESTRHIES